jgi:hypothetical protein
MIPFENRILAEYPRWPPPETFSRVVGFNSYAIRPDHPQPRMHRIFDTFFFTEEKNLTPGYAKMSVKGSIWQENEACLTFGQPSSPCFSEQILVILSSFIDSRTVTLSCL